MKGNQYLYHLLPPNHQVPLHRLKLPHKNQKEADHKIRDNKVEVGRKRNQKEIIH